MPSKSRKKMKGQARKAKANNKNATKNMRHVFADGRGASTIQITNHNGSLCYHGQANKTPDICVQFITTFFNLYVEKIFDNNISIDRVDNVNDALKITCNKYPEVVNNENNLDVVKKGIVSNGVSYLLGRKKRSHYLELFLGCAMALMYIDTYAPTSRVSAGLLSTRNAKDYVTNVDILNGCQRSLVKYFVKQIPCKCLDELYSQVKKVTPKTGICANCKETKARSSLYICTGCERIQYCSRACQMANVSEHKTSCKYFQGFDREKT